MKILILYQPGRISTMPASLPSELEKISAVIKQEFKSIIEAKQTTDDTATFKELLISALNAKLSVNATNLAALKNQLTEKQLNVNAYEANQQNRDISTQIEQIKCERDAITEIYNLNSDRQNAQKSELTNLRHRRIQTKQVNFQALQREHDAQITRNGLIFENIKASVNTLKVEIDTLEGELKAQYDRYQKPLTLLETEREKLKKSIKSSEEMERTLEEARRHCNDDTFLNELRRPPTSTKESLTRVTRSAAYRRRGKTNLHISPSFILITLLILGSAVILSMTDVLNVLKNIGKRTKTNRGIPISFADDLAKKHPPSIVETAILKLGDIYGNLTTLDPMTSKRLLEIDGIGLHVVSKPSDHNRYPDPTPILNVSIPFLDKEFSRGLESFQTLLWRHVYEMYKNCAHEPIDNRVLLEKLGSDMYQTISSAWLFYFKCFIFWIRGLLTDPWPFSRYIQKAVFPEEARQQPHLKRMPSWLVIDRIRNDVLFFLQESDNSTLNGAGLESRVYDLINHMRGLATINQHFLEVHFSAASQYLNDWFEKTRRDVNQYGRKPGCHLQVKGEYTELKHQSDDKPADKTTPASLFSSDVQSIIVDVQPPSISELEIKSHIRLIRTVVAAMIDAFKPPSVIPKSDKFKTQLVEDKQTNKLLWHNHETNTLTMTEKFIKSLQIPGNDEFQQLFNLLFKMSIFFVNSCSTDLQLDRSLPILPTYDSLISWVKSICTDSENLTQNTPTNLRQPAALQRANEIKAVCKIYLETIHNFQKEPQPTCESDIYDRIEQVAKTGKFGNYTQGTLKMHLDAKQSAKHTITHFLDWQQAILEQYKKNPGHAPRCLLSSVAP